MGHKAINLRPHRFMQVGQDAEGNLFGRPFDEDTMTDSPELGKVWRHRIQRDLGQPFPMKNNATGEKLILVPAVYEIDDENQPLLGKGVFPIVIQVIPVEDQIGSRVGTEQPPLPDWITSPGPIIETAT